METYCEEKTLENNRQFNSQRQENFQNVSEQLIDAPIRSLIRGFTELPFCFTLQCCYGHFIHCYQKDIHNLTPLPADDSIAKVTYRIAYIAVCIANNNPGRKMLDRFREIAGIDPEYVQFGCADWFWERQINSYVLQVEPDRFKYQDTAVMDVTEARHVERVRNRFFIQLQELLVKIKHS